MRELENPEQRALCYETAVNASTNPVKKRIMRAVKKQQILELIGPDALRRATIKRMAQDGVDAAEAEQRILWRE